MGIGFPTWFFKVERMGYRIAKVNSGEVWLSDLRLLLDDGRASSIEISINLTIGKKTN